MLRSPLWLPVVSPASPAVDGQPSSSVGAVLARMRLFSPTEGCSREDAVLAGYNIFNLY